MGESDEGQGWEAGVDYEPGSEVWKKAPDSVGKWCLRAGRCGNAV